MTTPPRWGTPRSKRPTYGHHLARVGQALGWNLFDWQRLVADVALEHDNGRYRYRTVGVSVGRQNGKTATSSHSPHKIAAWPGTCGINTAN